MSNVYLINGELGVRVVHEGYNLNVQLRFHEDDWINVNSFHEMSNDYAYSSARNSFKYECEKRRKQIEETPWMPTKNYKVPQIS